MPKFSKPIKVKYGVPIYHKDVIDFDKGEYYFIMDTQITTLDDQLNGITAEKNDIILMALKTKYLRVVNWPNKIQLLRVEIRPLATIFIAQNAAPYCDTEFVSINKTSCFLPPTPIHYLPLLYNHCVMRILAKTVECKTHPRADIKVSTELHSSYTSKFSPDFRFPIVHSASDNILFSNTPHTHQLGYKVFLPIIGKFEPFIGEGQGMTQSVAYILCRDKEEATNLCLIFSHPLYAFLLRLCRWTRFNSVELMRKFPIINTKYSGNKQEIYYYMSLGDEEVKLIEHDGALKKLNFGISIV